MQFLMGLICFIFIATFSSQTLVDICDSVIVFTAGYLIFKNKDFTYLKELKKTWFFWIGWLLIIFIGLFMNSQSFPWIYFLEFRWFISFFAMIYILIQIKDTPALIKYIGLTMLILNIIALALYFIRGDSRAGGIYNGVMAFSQNMSMATCFLVTYLIGTDKTVLSKSVKNIFIVTAATSALIILLTLTRGVWLATIIGVSISAFLIPKKVFIYTLTTIILAFVMLIFLSTSFNDRIFSKDENSKMSNSQRKNIIRANYEILKDYPIFGAGYTLNNARLTEYYDKLGIPQTEIKSHAHNQFLHFAAGTGILGLICYLIFLGKVFLTGLKSYFSNSEPAVKATYLSLISAFISFVIAGLTESNFSISKNRFLFIFFCAFIIAQNYKINTAAKN